ncbi:MAG: GFA family protein [Burkholderiales bacterium]
MNEEPVTFYACHCTDCQKRSGSSFGLSMWVNRLDRDDRVCAQCGTLLWTEPEKLLRLWRERTAHEEERP